MLATGHRPPTTLVLGLGNPLRGDDGIGPAVIEVLRPEREGLTLIESSGHDLVDWLGSDAFDRIMVVDAADLGQAPGSWRRLTPASLAAASTGELSHGMGLVQSLELLEALGRRPAPISIYAVQPAEVGWTPRLSRQAERAVQEVAAAIRHELCLPELPRLDWARTVLRTDEDVRCLSSDGKAT